MVVPRLVEVGDRLHDLQAVIVVVPARAGGRPPRSETGLRRYLEWDDVLNRASPAFAPRATSPDDPALIIYTSGTTGPSNGALHGHPILLGHVPSFQLYFDFVPQRGEAYWTPADFAWIGGSDVPLFPAQRHGGPVRGPGLAKVDPQSAVHPLAPRR